MEKCFIIENSANLYKRYYAYEGLQKRNHETVRKFVAENITEVKGYSYIAGEAFSITLDDDIYKKFNSQLMRDYKYVGEKKLYTFKKRSPIGKLYAALNIMTAVKPCALWEADIMRGRNRLFDYEGILYATVESDEINMETIFPEG